MANRFTFSKLWTNPEDFPTVETSEAQVRADMQCLFDELATAINGLGTASDKAVVTTLGTTNSTIPTSKAVKDAIDAIIISGGGDMLKSNYDTTNTGNKVDTALNAENLGGTAASGYLKSADAGTTFPKPGLVYASATRNTMDALTTQLNTWVSGMSSNTVRYYLVNVGSGYSYGPFVQAGYLLMLYKRSAELACAFFFRASSAGNMVISMTMTTENNAPVWSDAGSVTFSDNNSLSTSQVRNIYAGTADMTAGSTDLATGRIYLVYEV